MTIKDYDFIHFEWDDNKSDSNQTKHGLSFNTAHYAFFDPKILTTPDGVVDGEERWKSIARLENNFIILFIGHLYDADENKEYVRIITARRATPSEQEAYYANH